MARLTRLVQEIRNHQTSAAPTPLGAVAEGLPAPAPVAVGAGQPCCNHDDGACCQQPMLHDGPHQ